MLYMAVTADKYELPLIVEDSISKLAAKTGISVHTIRTSIDRNQSGHRRGFKFVKVEEDELNEETSKDR